MTPTDIFQAELTAAYGRHLERRRARRNGFRLAVATALGTLVVTGAALGASAVLGWPAPEHVKKDIAAVDQGMPADLRLNPDVESARAVASSGSSTLYAASLRDGGHCTELVTAGHQGRGATCAAGAGEPARAIDVAVPADEGAGAQAPVVLAGRVNKASATGLLIVYQDGTSDTIPFGDDRYFVFEVPGEHVTTAHAGGFELVARDDHGSDVGRAAVPADWDDPPVPDESAPLFASTRSDESDFTKVYGIEGHVGAPGVAALELSYDDETVRIPIAVDGGFEYTVPAGRIGDFMEPRELRAIDGEGNVVTSTFVAAVAYWRGANGG